MERAFVDASAWREHTDRLAPRHAEVRDALSAFEGRLVTSNFVFDEALTICRYELGHAVAKALGEELRAGTAEVVRVAPDDEEAAWALFLEREDQEYSFTDCTSFVLMRRLGIKTAIALDRDFEAERFEVLPILEPRRRPSRRRRK